jgi:hypothetical protein
MCSCECGQVVFELPEPPMTINRCHCSLCKLLSKSESMTFSKVYGRNYVCKINQCKYLILNNISCKIDLSKIGLFKSSTLAQRGYCKQCVTPIFLRYNDGSLWINIHTFEHNIIDDELRTEFGSVPIHDVFIN